MKKLLQIGKVGVSYYVSTAHNKKSEVHKYEKDEKTDSE